MVLFVGEALVGNEAVDQLVKFNQALADYSSSVTPHLIDGIVLTKFDTIDDKVYSFICFYIFIIFIPCATYILYWKLYILGWSCNFNDIYHRSTNSICWNWSNIYRSQVIKCKGSGCCSYEMKFLIVFTLHSSNIID